MAMKQTQTKMFDFADVGLDFCSGSKNLFPDRFKKMLSQGYNEQTVASVSVTGSQVTLNYSVAHGYAADRVLKISSGPNLAPISVIKMVADSGGGFVYSEKDSNTLTIKPLYKKAFWDSLTVDEYDRLIPESIVTAQSTDYELYPDYNGITLTNDRSGKLAQVKRTGTSADTLLPAENNPLFDHVSMGSFGKAKLAKAGMVETHTFTMPISQKVGECVPGEVLAFNAEWWGVVDSISVAFTHSNVNQTIKVERVNHE